MTHLPNRRSALAADVRQSLMEFFRDAYLMPQTARGERDQKMVALAELAGLADEMLYYITTFREGIESRMRLLEVNDRGYRRGLAPEAHGEQRLSSLSSRAAGGRSDAGTRPGW